MCPELFVDVLIIVSPFIRLSKLLCVRVILCICPELFVVVRVTSLVGGSSTLLREMVTEWLCPELLVDGIENEVSLSLLVLGDVVSESP